MEYNFDRFYSSDADTAINMIRGASAECQRNREAMFFLRTVAARPHDLPDVKQEAAQHFWLSQEQYFYSYLHKHFPTYKKDYESLMSAIGEAFIVALPGYDPHYAPGTYFTIRAHNAIYNEIRRIHDHLIPEHKFQIKRKLALQAEELERAGLPVTVESLKAAVPNVEERDIRDMIPLLIDGGNGTLSLDSCGNDQAIAELQSPRPTPEDIAIQNDKDKAFHQFLVDNFTERERNILHIYYLGTGKISTTKTRLKEAFGYDDITDDEIRRIISDVKNRICNAVIDRPNSDYVKALVNSSPDYNAKRGIRREISTEQEAEYFDSGWVKTADYVKELPRQHMKEKDLEQLAKGKTKDEIAGQISLVFGNESHEHGDDNMEPGA